MEGNERIPVLIGCTASGKTAALLRIARQRDFEVISADSRQVYRGMDIGTAKPAADERNRLKHHLIDIIDPDEFFSAGEFTESAVKLISEIGQGGGVPLVSGGTALYIIALSGGIDPLPSKCTGVREGLAALEEERPGILHRMLEEIDTATAGRTGANDLVRQIRALEIHILTGRRPSDLRSGGDPAAAGGFRIAGIALERSELRRRIVLRTEAMIESGLVDEVESLSAGGWGRETALGRTIGYREVMDYLEGGIASLEELKEAISAGTWHLARRQCSMFGRLGEVTWFKGGHDEIEKFLFD